MVYTNEDIVFEYFKLIKNKDIESLMDLFASDALVFEPFSKMTGGLKGKRAIESFLRVAIMANIRSSLKRNLISMKPSQIAEVMVIILEDNTNVIAATVKFEKGDSIKAGFTFELTSDDSGNDHAIGQKYNRIKTLHIHFLE